MKLIFVAIILLFELAALIVDIGGGRIVYR